MSASVKSPTTSSDLSLHRSLEFLRKCTHLPPMQKDILTPVVIVHSGAGTIPLDHWTPRCDLVKHAVNRAYDVLLSPAGNVIDAVEAAVKVMEDDPSCNAGYGSYLTLNGEVEMDALIMEGTQLRAGAVGAVSRVANPITLSRKIMEQSDHVLLVGSGAHQFAQSVGLTLIEPQQLISKNALDKLEKHKKSLNPIQFCQTEVVHDTVGAVAVDSEGHVASATSTGGMTGQLAGRVGDTPVIGAGGIADDFIGAVSTTGHGEMIMRVCLASRITELMKQGIPTQEAVVAGLEYMNSRVQSRGGAICVSNCGDIGIHFTTEHMTWAYRKGNSLHYGLKQNEDISEVVQLD